MADEPYLPAAKYGLEWEAKRQGLNLFSYDTERLAANAVHHALSSGHVIERADLNEAIDAEKRKADQYLRRACAAEVAADRQRSKLQAALSAWPDRESAEVLAKECGLLLLPESEGRDSRDA